MLGLVLAPRQPRRGKSFRITKVVMLIILPPKTRYRVVILSTVFRIGTVLSDCLLDLNTVLQQVPFQSRGLLCQEVRLCPCLVSCFKKKLSWVREGESEWEKRERGRETAALISLPEESRFKGTGVEQRAQASIQRNSIASLRQTKVTALPAWIILL